MPLVELLSHGGSGAQETAAGAIAKLGESASNRVSVAEAGAIPLLVAMFDGGSDEAIEQAAAALMNLVIFNVKNQLAIAQCLVEMLKTGSLLAQEHVTRQFEALAQDPDNRGAIAKAGAVPELVRQLEGGTEKAMGMAASGLALIALKSAEHRATVTQELVKLLASNHEAVRQRSSEALRKMASDEVLGTQGTIRERVRQAAVEVLVNLRRTAKTATWRLRIRSLVSLVDQGLGEQGGNCGIWRHQIADCRLVIGRLSAVAQGTQHRCSGLLRSEAMPWS